MERPTPKLHVKAFSYAEWTHNSMTDMPDKIDPEDRTLFLDSLEPTTLASQRSTALLWEHDLLPRYPNIPFFMVRVADMRATLSSSATALALYKQIQQIIGPSNDAVFDAFILKYEAITEEFASRQALVHANIRYWQPYKRSRECRLPIASPYLPEGSEAILEQWTTVFMGKPLMTTFFNYYFLETNMIEHAFLLSERSLRNLARSGFKEDAVEYLRDSEVKDKSVIVDLLQDTQKAYQKMALIVANLELLTPQAIKDIHYTLMQHSMVLPVTDDTSNAGSEHLKYTTIGETRNVTRKTVLINTNHYRIGFCPYLEVDTELLWICQQAQQWIRTFRNPFAVAAWLHLVFVRCHPFDDGNGRLGRFIASIPLIRAGYPPICIPRIMQDKYINGIQAAYDGKLSDLADCFATSLEITIQEVRKL